MFEYTVVKTWSTASTLNKIVEMERQGWELVSTHPRFVFVVPFPIFPIGEVFGLVAVLRRPASGSGNAAA